MTIKTRHDGAAKLAAGLEVRVRTLKRRGVVVAAMNGGVYRVQVGALVITAGEADLEAEKPTKKKRKAGRTESGSKASEAAAGHEAVPQSIDLHGLTVEEARNRVAGYISRAILAGHDRVEIVHGIGTGKLKAAVTKDLRALQVVRAVKPHPTNPGVTVAYL